MLYFFIFFSGAVGEGEHGDCYSTSRFYLTQPPKKPWKRKAEKDAKTSSAKLNNVGHMTPAVRCRLSSLACSVLRSYISISHLLYSRIPPQKLLERALTDMYDCRMKMTVESCDPRYVLQSYLNRM